MAMDKIFYRIQHSREKDKIVVTTYKDGIERVDSRKAQIRINEALFEELTEMSKQTLVPVSKLASACIEYCLHSDKFEFLCIEEDS